MRITVEFFDIPRQRAGCALLEVSFSNGNETATLSDVLEALAKHRSINHGPV